MNIKDLSKPLTAEQIEFRVQSITKDWKWAIILAYKNARVDMERLDEVCWPLNWKREHTRDNKNCIVSIWDEIKNQWVSKEDTGTESNTEKEKGLASDSFKRACFNRWIGRELYDFPFIYINTEDWETEYKEWKYIAWSKFLKWWTWTVNWTHIVAKDKKGKVRFETWKETSPQEEPKTDEDKRQRYNDSNFDNMVDAIADGKVSFTDWNDALSKIKEKYRVSGKMEQQILSYFK